MLGVDLVDIASEGSFWNIKNLCGRYETFNFSHVTNSPQVLVLLMALNEINVFSSPLFPPSRLYWKKKKKSIQVMGFSHLLSLFSLSVLDTRLDPPSDEKKRQQIIAKAGPARWKTREFYIYGFIFAICVPLMCKGAIDASRCKH